MSNWETIDIDKEGNLTIRKYLLSWELYIDLKMIAKYGIGNIPILNSDYHRR